MAFLAHEGLVSQVAFTRWQVAETSAVDAWELYTLRAALEALAARLAATNVTASDGKRLRKTGAELAMAVQENRFSDVTDIDFRLHQEIVELARHRRLAEQHDYILQQVRFHMLHSGFLPRDYSALLDEHTALIDAVINHDLDLAEQLARIHNEAEVKLLSAFVEQKDAAAN